MRSDSFVCNKHSCIGLSLEKLALDRTTAHNCGLLDARLQMSESCGGRADIVYLDLYSLVQRTIQDRSGNLDVGWRGRPTLGKPYNIEVAPMLCVYDRMRM